MQVRSPGRENVTALTSPPLLARPIRNSFGRGVIGVDHNRDRFMRCTVAHTTVIRRELAHMKLMFRAQRGFSRASGRANLAPLRA
jgi:hypothetical protein